VSYWNYGRIFGKWSPSWEGPYSVVENRSSKFMFGTIFVGLEVASSKKWKIFCCMMIIWPMCYSKSRPKKIWPMCSPNIVLGKCMAGEVINAVLRYCYNVFDKYNCTKNRGACVEYIIWLLGI
jgi:hypothetical protein